MTFVDLDLSTAVFPDSSATLVSGVITPTTGTWHYFTLPALVFNPAKTYQIQVDYTDATGTSQLWGYSQLSPDLDGYNNSEWGLLFLARPSEDPLTVGTSQRTFTAGVYIRDWNADVYHAGEHYLLFEWNTAMKIAGVRWQEVPGETLPPAAVGGSDTWQGAGLLYSAEEGVATPQAPLTLSGDEPPLPSPTFAARTAWWKLQPLTEPTWFAATNYTGSMEVFWRSPTLGWVQKLSTFLGIYEFKANIGQEYYIRVTPLASDPTTDLVASVEVDPSPPPLDWQWNYTLPAHPAPGGSLATAATVTPGGPNSVSQVLPSARDAAYTTSRQEASDLFEGWYKFTADKSGLVQIAASMSNGSVSLWGGGDLIGARWNSNTILVAAVTKGVSYGIRITGFTSDFDGFRISKVAGVVDGFVPMSSVTGASGAGYTGTVGVATADLVVTAGTGSPSEEAGLCQFNLGGIAVPAGGTSGRMAEARFETDCISGSDLTNDGLSFDFAGPTGGSDLFYWTFDQWYQPTTRRVRYVSLYTGFGSMIVLESDVVAGTIPTHFGTPGVGFALSRWLFRRAGDTHTVYLSTTGLRAYWFADTDPLDGEVAPPSTSAIARTAASFVARS